MGLQSGAILSLGVTGVFTTAANATVIFLMNRNGVVRVQARSKRPTLSADEA